MALCPERSLVPEGMLKPADPLSSSTKVDEGRDYSHLPVTSFMGVAATVLAKRKRVEKAAKFIVVDLQREALS